jgi:opacity protein-like surface antigen
MIFKKGIFLLLGFVCCISVPAQDDFGSSLSVDITKRIVKGFNVTFEEEYRTRSGFSETDRLSHTLELSYKPIRYLKVGGAYNLINFNHEKKDWEIRHRYYFFATGMMDVGRFGFSLRERFQSTKRQGVEETAKRANPKLYLRSRLKVDYNIPKCKIDPFVSVELFHSLNDPQGNSMDRWRGIAGAEYKLNKKNTFQLYYRYTDHTSDDDSDHHMLGAGYSFKF